MGNKVYVRAHWRSVVGKSVSPTTHSDTDKRAQIRIADSVRGRVLELSKQYGAHLINTNGVYYTHHKCHVKGCGKDTVLGRWGGSKRKPPSGLDQRLYEEMRTANGTEYQSRCMNCGCRVFGAFIWTDKTWVSLEPNTIPFKSNRVAGLQSQPPR